jgi:hypothetical protein
MKSSAEVWASAEPTAGSLPSEAALLSAGRANSSTLLAHFVDIVGTGHRMDTMRQNQRKGVNSKSDDYGSKNESLRDRVGEGARHGGFPFGNNRGARARQTAAGKDQKIRAVAQEAEADNQLSKAAPEH